MPVSSVLSAFPVFGGRPGSGGRIGFFPGRLFPFGGRFRRFFRGISRSVPFGHLRPGDGHQARRPFPAHLFQLRFPVSGQGGLDDDAGIKNLPDRGRQPVGDIVLPHILQGEFIRKSEGDPVSLAVPVNARQPGHHGRIVPPQEIGQHAPVGADILQEMIPQGRAHHPDRQRPPGKYLPQDPFQLQEFLLPHQLRTLEGNICFFQRFDIGCPGCAQLAGQSRNLPDNPADQILVAHFTLRPVPEPFPGPSGSESLPGLLPPGQGPRPSQKASPRRCRRRRCPRPPLCLRPGR